MLSITLSSKFLWRFKREVSQ